MSPKRCSNLYFNKGRGSDFKEQMIPNAVYHLQNRAGLLPGSLTAVSTRFSLLQWQTSIILVISEQQG